MGETRLETTARQPRNSGPSTTVASDHDGDLTTTPKPSQCSIRTLPPELIFAIISEIDTVNDLAHFVFTTRFIYQCFQERRETTLWSLLRVELAPVMAEAKFLLRCLNPDKHSENMLLGFCIMHRDSAGHLARMEKLRIPYFDCPETRDLSGREKEELFKFCWDEMNQLCRTSNTMTLLAALFMAAPNVRWPAGGTSGKTKAEEDLLSQMQSRSVLRACYMGRINRKISWAKLGINSIIWGYRFTDHGDWLKLADNRDNEPLRYSRCMRAVISTPPRGFLCDRLETDRFFAICMDRFASYLPWEVDGSHEPWGTPASQGQERAKFPRPNEGVPPTGPHERIPVHSRRPVCDALLPAFSWVERMLRRDDNVKRVDAALFRAVCGDDWVV